MMQAPIINTTWKLSHVKCGYCELSEPKGTKCWKTETVTIKT